MIRKFVPEDREDYIRFSTDFYLSVSLVLAYYSILFIKSQMHKFCCKSPDYVI